MWQNLPFRGFWCLCANAVNLLGWRCICIIGLLWDVWDAYWCRDCRKLPRSCHRSCCTLIDQLLITKKECQACRTRYWTVRWVLNGKHAEDQYVGKRAENVAAWDRRCGRNSVEAFASNMFLGGSGQVLSSASSALHMVRYSIVFNEWLEVCWQYGDSIQRIWLKEHGTCYCETCIILGKKY